MKFKYFSARGKETTRVERKGIVVKVKALLTIHLFTCVLFKTSPEGEGAK